MGLFNFMPTSNTRNFSFDEYSSSKFETPGVSTSCQIDTDDLEPNEDELKKEQVRRTLWVSNFCLSCFFSIPAFILGILILSSGTCESYRDVYSLNHEIGVFLVVSGIVTFVCSPFSLTLNHKIGNLAIIYYFFILGWNIWATTIVAQNRRYCADGVSGWNSGSNGMAFISGAVYCAILYVYLIVVPSVLIVNFIKHRRSKNNYNRVPKDVQSI